MAKKKNILNNFFNMDENEELNLTEEQQYDEELSNILEKEVEEPVVVEEPKEEEPKVEEIMVENKYTIVEEPVVVEKRVEEPKPERKISSRMKRRLGIV